MRKLWLIRKDQEAVSPVIATILMVAITVVLAAVLYVMVSGLLTPTGGGPRSMGVNPSKSSDGTTWILAFSRVPSGLTLDATKLEVFKGDGTVNLTSRAFSTLTYANSGCVYSGNGDNTVDVGERIVCRASWYVTGSSIQIADTGGILYSGALTG